MPGSGISESNITLIARGSEAREFHLTGRKTIDSNMTFRRENVSLGGSSDLPEFTRKVADGAAIAGILGKLKLI